MVHFGHVADRGHVSAVKKQSMHDTFPLMSIEYKQDVLLRPSQKAGKKGGGFHQGAVFSSRAERGEHVLRLLR